MNEKVLLENINGQNIFQLMHDSGSKQIVIFCHGFRGTSVGPSRSFVEIARKLSDKKICSARFDQHGSGNSSGDFIDSSFIDWVTTTKILARKYIDQNYEVILFGQSMGGATVIDVASQIPEIKAVVAWVPDPNVDEGDRYKDDEIEEGGQLIKGRYWIEAKDSKIAEKLSNVKCPSYIVQCSNDEYVSGINHQAIAQNANSNHVVEMFQNYSHSSWTYEQFQEIIDKSLKFILKSFQN